MTRLADKFADRLMEMGKKVSRARDGYEAQCPGHDDRNKSLSINTGDDGRLLLNCHANCEFNEIMTAAGMGTADAFPPKNAPARANKMNGNGHPPKPPPTWPTILSVAEAYRPGIAKNIECRTDEVTYKTHWVYHRRDRSEHGAVMRFNLPTPPAEKQKKTFRPARPVPGGWAMGDPVGKWPLFRLPDIAGRRCIYVMEGEGKALVAAACGIPATASAHGAGSAKKTDWGDCDADEFVIVPDHDEASEKWVAEVSAEIWKVKPGVVVKVVRLAELAGEGFPAHGDFVEFAGEFRDGAEADTIRAELDTAADKAVPAVPEKSKCHDVIPKPENPSHDARGSADEGGMVPVMTCLASVERKEVSWVWPGRIPLSRLTLIVGVPGVGKSFFTSYMTAVVTTGRSWTDGTACPSGSVIIVSAEDDPGDTIGPRCDAHGADSNRVHILSGVMWKDPEGEKHEVVFTLANIAALEAAMQQLPDLKLIIIDPVGSYMGGKVDAHRDNEVRGVLAPVAKLAEKYNVAVVIVCHRRKSAGHSADDMALGSRAFTGIARAVWHLSRDPENKDRRLLLPGKNNLSREGDGLAFSIGGQPARLIWEEEPVAMSADEGLAAENSVDREKPGPDPKVRDEATKWLEQLLKSRGQITVKEVEKEAKGAAMAWRTVQRAAEQLDVIRQKETGFGGVWTWSLPCQP